MHLLRGFSHTTDRLFKEDRELLADASRKRSWQQSRTNAAHDEILLPILCYCTANATLYCTLCVVYVCIYNGDGVGNVADEPIGHRYRGKWSGTVERKASLERAKRDELKEE